MKLKFTYLAALLIVVLIYTGCQEDNNDDDDNIPVYTQGETILNPPDEFEILFLLRDIGNYQAIVIFDTDAVWDIERYSAATAMLWMQRQYDDSTARIDILSNIQLGLKGGQVYTVNGSNSMPAVDQNLFIRFTKMPYNYDTFPGKF